MEYYVSILPVSINAVCSSFFSHIGPSMVTLGLVHSEPITLGHSLHVKCLYLNLSDPHFSIPGSGNGGCISLSFLV